MSKNYRIFITIVTILAIFAGIFWYSETVGKNKGTTADAPNTAQAPFVSPQELKKNYETSLTAMVNDFSRAYRSGDAGAKKTAADQAKLKILTLTVPTEYKDLHIGLIIALSTISEGDQEAGEQKIMALAKSNSWIGSVSLQ